MKKEVLNNVETRKGEGTIMPLGNRLNHRITLARAVEWAGGGVDVGDVDWDWEAYFSCKNPDDESEEFVDAYDSFMYLLGELTPVTRIRADEDSKSYFVIADFSGMLWNHREVFEKFFNEQNRVGYRPCDYPGCRYDEDSGFYEAFMMPLTGLMAGVYAEEDYQELYETLMQSWLNKKIGGKKDE